MKAWRNTTGLSQEKMGEKIGLSKSTLSRIENGQTDYYQAVVEAYAEVCGCQPLDIIGHDPADPSELWLYSLERPIRERLLSRAKDREEDEENGDAA